MKAAVLLMGPRGFRVLGAMGLVLSCGTAAPPQVRIVPIPISNDPDTVHLICHVWGFYPPAVTIQWLHNGLVVASGDTKLLPNGDWTYRTQVALRASTAAGSTYTCSVWHSSLEQPLQEDWSPNLSPAMMVKVAVAAMALTLGLVALSAGVFSFCQRPRGAFMVHVANSCPLAANGSLRGFDLTVAFNKNPLVCYDPDGHLFNACDWGLLHGVAGQIAIALNNDSTWVQRAEARRRACSKLAAQFWAQTALRRSPGLTLEVTLMVAVATVVMVLGLSLLFIGVYCWRAQPPAPGYAPLPGHNYPSGSI